MKSSSTSSRASIAMGRADSPPHDGGLPGHPACPELRAAAATKLSNQMEQAHPAHDMADRIKELFSNGRLQRVNVVVSDQRHVQVQDAEAAEARGSRHTSSTRDIWDIERLHRCVTSGRAREPIEIDFEEDFGAPSLACRYPLRRRLSGLPGSRAGDVLRKLYDEYGPRLLELNVLPFLQARGKVNRGSGNHPQGAGAFLAYNNGLTAMAEEVRQNCRMGPHGHHLGERPPDRQRRADDGLDPPRRARGPRRTVRRLWSRPRSRWSHPELWTNSSPSSPATRTARTR